MTANAQKKVIEDKEIEEIILNNFDDMDKSLHPRLAKRGLNPNSTLSEDFPPERLKRTYVFYKAKI